jgi:hypothetical protein
MTLQDKINQLCKQAGIWKKELAEALGIHLSGLCVISENRKINHILIGLLTNVQAETGLTGRAFLDLIEPPK